MIVNIPHLLLVLLLLWFPRQWLRFGSIIGRRRSKNGGGKAGRTTEPWKDREPGDPKVIFRTEFTKFRNYVDLIRAGAATLELIGKGYMDACLQAARGETTGQLVVLLALKALILLIAVLIQTFRYENRRVTFYPPIFFLAGLSVGLCLPVGAIFAFALMWAFNIALPGPESFLTVYAVVTLAFGKYFDGLPSNSCILESFLCFLPVLLSLLSRRPLVIFSRKSHRTAEAAS